MFLRRRIGLFHDEEPIDTETSEQLISPIGPDHFEAVDARQATEPEMLAVIHRRHVPPVRGMVDVLLLAAGREDQCRADAPFVRRLTLELDPQTVMGVVARLDIVIDEGRGVDVIHHEIEPAIVIEVGVGGAVRETRTLHPPCSRLVRERQVPVVPKDVAGLGVRGKPLQDFQSRSPRFTRASASACGERGIDVIEIVDCLGIAVADEDVLVTVVVEVGKESAPTPVSV